MPAVTEADKLNALKDLRYWRADAVVLSEHRHAEALHTFLTALRGEGQRVADAWVWDVRALTRTN